MAREIDHILTRIDYATEPRLMSKAKAKEFLEELIEELKSRIEALNEEMG